MTDAIDHTLDRILRSPFRARQRLGPREIGYLEQRGVEAVLGEARRFLLERIAPSDVPDDGRQTPMRGHPAFVAQHATATCCRGCLAKHHAIDAGRPLTDREVEHVVDLIERWLCRCTSGVTGRQRGLFDRAGAAPEP